jgi:DNA-binding MarR family transcriptional regulator
MTEIKDLISYQLHTVANLLSRGAELRYRREFGVSLWEWRTIALLGAKDEPQSLGHLARAAGIDKSQMSRVVSGLAKRESLAQVLVSAFEPIHARRRRHEELVRAA